jgi:hypothetical protein
VPEYRERFWKEVKILGSGEELNLLLEKAGRVADFIELAELLCHDALHREESCGAHFREEHQAADGEAQRNDQDFTYVAAWEFTGIGETPKLHKEPLEFEYVKLTQRASENERQRSSEAHVWRQESPTSRAARGLPACEGHLHASSRCSTSRTSACGRRHPSHHVRSRQGEGFAARAAA